MGAVATQKQIFITRPKYAFLKGWKQIPDDDKIIVKIEIMQLFSIISDAAWRRRIKGQVIPNDEQMRHVEAVFKKYKIKDPWGL